MPKTTNAAPTSSTWTPPSSSNWFRSTRCSAATSMLHTARATASLRSTISATSTSIIQPRPKDKARIKIAAAEGGEIWVQASTNRSWTMWVWSSSTTRAAESTALRCLDGHSPVRRKHSSHPGAAQDDVLPATLTEPISHRQRGSQKKRSRASAATKHPEAPFAPPSQPAPARLLQCGYLSSLPA